MIDKDSKGSGSTMAIIMVVVVLLLGLPCLAVVGLVGARLLVFQAYEVPTAVDSEPMVQESPLPVESAAPVESPVPAPAEDGK